MSPTTLLRTINAFIYKYDYIYLFVEDMHATVHELRSVDNSLQSVLSFCCESQGMNSDSGCQAPQWLPLSPPPALMPSSLLKHLLCLRLLAPLYRIHPFIQPAMFFGISRGKQRRLLVFGVLTNSRSLCWALGVRCHLAMAVGTLGVASSAPSALLRDPYISPFTGEFTEKPSNFFKDAQLLSGRLGIWSSQSSLPIHHFVSNLKSSAFNPVQMTTMQYCLPMVGLGNVQLQFMVKTEIHW